MRFDSSRRSRPPSAYGIRLQCWPRWVTTTLRLRIKTASALGRSSGQFEFEFRAGDLGVFYRIEDDQMLVDAIGRKRGNQLFINGRKVTL